MTGQQLKTLILSSGHSIESMADKIGVTRQGLNRQVNLPEPGLIYVLAIKFLIMEIGK